jgi:hypothetical protein
MALFDDPIEPHAVENLRRSIVMLSPGQAARIDRDKAILLLEELQRLQHERREVVAQLQGLLGALEGSTGPPPVGTPGPGAPRRR